MADYAASNNQEKQLELRVIFVFSGRNRSVVFFQDNSVHCSEVYYLFGFLQGGILFESV